MFSVLYSDNHSFIKGGILASPESKNMLAAMLKIMADRQIFKVYTGIHATFSKGDYTTITGTPLSELDVEWMQGEPDNLNKEEDCLVMYSSGRLADVKCTNDYPFICHKSPEMMNAHKCSYSQDGIESSDYVLYNKTLSCYKFHKEGRFWSDAFRTCLAEDAYLAIINSEDESQFLKELFAQHLPEDIPGDFFKDSASIGFTRSDNDLESFVTIHGKYIINALASEFWMPCAGVFILRQSLAEAGFSAFQAGQPNNPFDDESCGLMWRTGLLQHHNCHERVAFICEKPLPNAHSCSYPEDDNSDYVLSNKTGSCYKFHKEGLFWPDAYDTCQKEDANLAIINSEAESQVLKELFAQNPPQDIPGDFFKGSASIGFRRSVNNEESFVTIDGTPLSELDVEWMQGEPDNLNKEEDCLVMYSSGRLADVKCTNDYPFICHKSPEMMNAHKCSYSQDGIESSDYVLYNKTLSCYKFHKEGRFWSDAFRTCMAEDAYLAIINSEDESQFLKELFAQNAPEDIPRQSLAEAGFSTFQAGEPNNAGKNESCGSVWRTGLLNDYNCHKRVVFICEKPLPNAHSCSYPEDDNSDYVLSNKTGSCYKFHKEGLFWPDAYETCQKEDANLAIINSEAESQVLKELFAQNPPQDIPGDFFKGSASIGFKRSVNNEESFVTIDGHGNQKDHLVDHSKGGRKKEDSRQKLKFHCPTQ
ncbi:hypothetical protein MSG28_005275 [Choristoneura fumiferana]|uniref:Uncharacterized protein n=1 Tax=Choristoneura fumiferana TaxID=7141 RepID=A0ACC0JQK7_CHOFU|nr:hypothetical protein MSG28_005275 [Choristoneura fumiferana]